MCFCHIRLTHRLPDILTEYLPAPHALRIRRRGTDRRRGLHSLDNPTFSAPSVVWETGRSAVCLALSCPSFALFIIISFPRGFVKKDMKPRPQNGLSFAPLRRILSPAQHISLVFRFHSGIPFVSSRGFKRLICRDHSATVCG